jgi:hypothetical protein
LLGYEPDLAGWVEQHEAVEKTTRRVRLHGLQAGTLGELEQTGERPADDRGPGTGMVRGHLRAYVSRAVRLAAAGETLAGSSEVLEAAFGKLKAKAGAGGQRELTGLTLALDAIVDQPDEEEVRRALDAVPRKKADRMIARLVGRTLSWFRKRFSRAVASGPSPGPGDRSRRGPDSIARPARTGDWPRVVRGVRATRPAVRSRSTPDQVVVAGPSVRGRRRVPGR